MLLRTAVRADGQTTVSWYDAGVHPGSSQEAAIKKARQADPRFRAELAKGESAVAVPTAYFQPVKVKVETIEVESFERVSV